MSYREPAHAARRKRIICIEHGLTFDSIKSASIHYGLSPQSISNTLRGKQKTAGGYRFRFVDPQPSEDETLTTIEPQDEAEQP